VKDAHKRGIDVTLASASAAELTLSPMAARYTMHNDLARQALFDCALAILVPARRQRRRLLPRPLG